jgi:hypothetical protein
MVEGDFRMTAEVTDYIKNLKLDWQLPICEQLRQIVHQSIPDVMERLQYGKPHFLKDGNYACVFGTAKGWVSFTIFNATDIDGPAGFFEDGPPERKTVKIKAGQTVDYEMLGDLLRQAASGL